MGPVLGAILLGAIQQIATVTISSAINLLIVGLLIVDCVIIAPNGIIGLIKERRASSDLVAQPAVFALLYVLNVIPIYFLQQQGRSLDDAVLAAQAARSGQFLAYLAGIAAG